MKSVLGRLNGFLSLIGIFSLILGAILLIWPGLSFATFLFVFGFYLILHGVTLAAGVLLNSQIRSPSGLVVGVLTIITGIYILMNPENAGILLLYLISVWAILAGAILLTLGFSMGKADIWLILFGTAAVFFGFYTFSYPKESALGLIKLIGIFSVLIGLIYIISAYKVKKVIKRMLKN